MRSDANNTKVELLWLFPLKRYWKELLWYESEYAKPLSWAEMGRYRMFFIPQIPNVFVCIITTLFSHRIINQITVQYMGCHFSLLNNDVYRGCISFILSLVSCDLCSKINTTCLDLSAQVKDYLRIFSVFSITQTISKLNNFFQVCSYLASRPS